MFLSIARSLLCCPITKEAVAVHVAGGNSLVMREAHGLKTKNNILNKWPFDRF